MDGYIVRVKQFEGYGFIRGEDGVERFFHRSAVLNVHWDDVQAPNVVAFDDDDTGRGPRAANVVLV